MQQLRDTVVRPEDQTNDLGLGRNQNEATDNAQRLLITMGCFFVTKEDYTCTLQAA